RALGYAELSMKPMSHEREPVIFSGHIPDWPIVTEPVRTEPPVPATRYTVIGSLATLGILMLAIVTFDAITGWLENLAGGEGARVLFTLIFAFGGLVMIWTSVESFLMARWLKRRDPERDRGRMHFWLYVANGYNFMLLASVLGCQSLSHVADPISMVSAPTFAMLV